MEMFAAHIAREEMLAKVLLGLKQGCHDIPQSYIMPNYHAPQIPGMPSVSIMPNCRCANVEQNDESGQPPLKRARSETTSDKERPGVVTKSSSTILSGSSSLPCSPSSSSSSSSPSSSLSVPMDNSQDVLILSPVSDQGASARYLSSSSTSSSTSSTTPPLPIQMATPPTNVHKKSGSTHATKIYACGKCSSTFCTISNLNKHTRLIHQGIKKFQCPKCEQMFGQKSDMMKHVLSLHDETKPYQCNHCSSRFNQPGDVTKHARQKHSEKCK